MIALIGGTGPEGIGLAIRYALVSESVIIGSRRKDRAVAAADKVKEQIPHNLVQGMENSEAAEKADFVVITLPYYAQREVLSKIRENIGSKIVISTVVPMIFERGRPKMLPVEAGSAAEETQSLLPDAKVVSAFHNLSAKNLANLGYELEADVIVCSDHKDAKDAVMELIERLPGIQAVDGGPLASSRYVEALTALLSSINRIYKTESSIKVTGISRHTSGEP